MTPKTRRVLTWAGGLALAAFLAAQFVQPPRTNPAVDPARAIQAHVPVPPDVAAILDRACRDCHSFRTTWPWYSFVAPVSWFVRGHVNDGRRHLNFDDWMEPVPGDRKPSAERLDGICEEIQAGEMPLPSYIRLHAGAVLSAADVTTVCRWARPRLARAGR